MQELAVLLVGDIRLPLDLQQLKHQRPLSTDVGAPREEISAHQGFEDTRFAVALADDDDDDHLKELNRLLAFELREDVL